MYKKIMVPLDGSGLAECVLPHLETMVKECETTEVIIAPAAETGDLASSIDTRKERE
jgi:recombinational DNA repair protein RecR